MKNQFGQNTNENISKISVLEVYYFKVTTKQSLSSFCVNLEVVNFQGRNICVGILSKLIFHKDILKLTDLYAKDRILLHFVRDFDLAKKFS